MDNKLVEKLLLKGILAVLTGMLAIITSEYEKSNKP